MQLEIQAFGGIKVIEEIPADKSVEQIQSIVKNALDAALVVRDTYMEFVAENETDHERSLREFQQEQQELALRGARLQNTRARAMLDVEESPPEPANRAERRAAARRGR